jgi:hypothetical protein
LTRFDYERAWDLDQTVIRVSRENIRWQFPHCRQESP